MIQLPVNAKVPLFFFVFGKSVINVSLSVFMYIYFWLYDIDIMCNVVDDFLSLVSFVHV